MKPAVTRKEAKVHESSPSPASTEFAPRLRLLTGASLPDPPKIARIAGLHPAQLPYLLTAAEVAEYLRTTRKAVYAMAERGVLPAVRVGRRLLFKRDVVDLLLSKGSASSSGGERR